MVNLKLYVDEHGISYWVNIEEFNKNPKEYFYKILSDLGYGEKFIEFIYKEASDPAFSKLRTIGYLTHSLFDVLNYLVIACSYGINYRNDLLEYEL